MSSRSAALRPLQSTFEAQSKIRKATAVHPCPRGHGESPLGAPKDFSPQQLAADVRAALQAELCASLEIQNSPTCADRGLAGLACGSGWAQYGWANCYAVLASVELDGRWLKHVLPSKTCLAAWRRYAADYPEDLCVLVIEDMAAWIQFV